MITRIENSSSNTTHTIQGHNNHRQRWNETKNRHKSVAQFSCQLLQKKIKVQYVLKTRKQAVSLPSQSLERNAGDTKITTHVTAWLKGLAASLLNARARALPSQNLACENIRFSSLFAAGEKRMFSQATQNLKKGRLLAVYKS